MRISDWSSDVCSSDLCRPLFLLLLDSRDSGRQAQQYQRGPTALHHVPPTRMWMRTIHVSSTGGEGYLSIATQIVRRCGFTHIHHEIGRASCRESVCQ